MIELRGISKQYRLGDNYIDVLNNLNLTIESGSITTIYGPSGSGKSTLMNIIGGIDVDYKGDALFNNLNISNLNEIKICNYRNKNIGFIFQNFNLIDHLTAKENVDLALKLAGVKWKDRKSRIKELFMLVGLTQHINKMPNKLSGGEQQRVAIARALATNPDIILADEPTGSLDTETEIEILKILRHLADNGKTVVIVTHDKEVANWSDTIIHIDDGKIIEEKKQIGIAKIENRKIDINDYGRKSIAILFSLFVAIKNIFRKKVQTALLILSSALSLAAMLLIISINTNASDSIVERIDDFSYNPKLLKVYNLDPPNLEKSEELYNHITEELMYMNNIEGVSGAYYSNMRVGATLQMKRDEIIYLSNGYIDIRYYFKEEEDKYGVLLGNLPKNENEILVPYVIFEDMFDLKFLSKEGKQTMNEMIGSKINIMFPYTNNPMFLSNLEEYYPEITFEHLLNNSVKRELVISGISNDPRDQRIIRVHPNILNSLNSEEYIDIYNNKSKLYIYNEFPYAIIYEGEFPSSPSFYIYTETSDYKDVKEVENKLKEFNQYYEVENELIKYGDISHLLMNIHKIFFGFALLSIIITTMMISIILYVTTMQRVKEIGIYKAMGASRNHIRLIYIFESVIITVISVFFAYKLVEIFVPEILEIFFNYLRTIGFSYREAQFFVLYRLSLDYFVYVLIMGIIIGVVASLYPSNKASKLNTVDILRYE